MTGLPSLSESIALYREVYKPNPDAKIKIAILSSFTLKGLKESIFAQLHAQDIASDIYMGGYNQYAQEILKPSSKLYRFQPNIVFLFISTQSLLGEDYFLPYEKNNSERKQWVKTKHKELQSLIDALTSKTSAKVVVHNFSIPSYSPLAILENKQSFGIFESLSKLNILLQDSFKQNPQVFIFDYEGFCAAVGKERIFDPTMYYIGDVQVSFEMIPRLADAYMGYIKPLASRTKKCIVLDLDNTLWGGVIGEEGPSGIKLGPNPEGRPFFEFQKFLLALFKRGVILAINSKNNMSDVEEVFQKHPHMILKEKHFAAMQINWNDKASNMKALAKELNIGLDSMVFFDDDELNRELIRTKLPEVSVVDLPKNPALYPSVLFGLSDFHTLQLTKEDLKKGELYAKQRERVVFEQSTTNLDEFLKGLHMVVTLESANTINLPRITQLTQKTNQFNLTTHRYQQEEIERYIRDGDLVVGIHVKDKFGDNGLTGVAIVKKTTPKWIIDTFLLSCRVIGRRVEETLLYYIISEAKKAGAEHVEGDYIPTPKNELVKDFYKTNGFKLERENNGIKHWIFETKNPFPKPKDIRFVAQ